MYSTLEAPERRKGNAGMRPERRPSGRNGRIQADDFAVQDCRAVELRKFSAPRREGFEHVSLRETSSHSRGRCTPEPGSRPSSIRRCRTDDQKGSGGRTSVATENLGSGNLILLYWSAEARACNHALIAAKRAEQHAQRAYFGVHGDSCPPQKIISTFR